jgi:anthranilate phosphoribosyltransferase
MDLTGLHLEPARLPDLTGGDARTNAEILLGIFQGRDRGPRRAAAQINAAAALWIAGQAENLRHGWDVIGRIIDDGQGLAQVERLRKATVT